jgi:hypothetical protein
MERKRVKPELECTEKEQNLKPILSRRQDFVILCLLDRESAFFKFKNHSRVITKKEVEPISEIYGIVLGVRDEPDN